ncbi:unnamed protein product [Didymodactylos carnosus]|uniref:SWIM-type domain-containing protein n=1 Tax=Didymodactylos carnosus TaxID=1234261 RepID=A0A814E7H1_9BILA|nr:unnamed protein product [Didymodactylos carnosus]CAF3740544.1 unnamed protein product [Didymodactylos carnosus]
MHALGLHVAMPPFLRKRKQFTTIEANKSRLITKIRSNSSIKDLKIYLSIACALINCYKPEVLKSKPGDIESSKEMLELVNKPNLVEQLLNESNLSRFSNWTTVNATEFLEFPILTESQIRKLTFGIFQLKRARSYAEEYASSTDLTNLSIKYAVQVCKTKPDLCRVIPKSAHSKRKTYYPTIRFSKSKVVGWYCQCPIGSRVVGCCSHVASAIWFLGFERWQSHQRVQSSGSHLLNASDSIQITDFEDDDEDNQTRYRLA